MTFKRIIKDLKYKNHRKNFNFKLDFDEIVTLNNKPFIMFKDFNCQGDVDDFFKKFWNLGEVPILIAKLNDSFQVYNSGVFKKNNSNIWMNLKRDDLIKIFNYNNLDSFFKKYNKYFKRKLKVDDYLLNNLNLIKDKVPHNLITTLLFVRCLIDRNILKRDNFFKIYGVSFEMLILDKSKLSSFLVFLKNRFGGDIFKKTSLNCSEDDLNLLSSLFSGVDLTSNQEVLFDVYDFSIIPAEILGNIYEKFTKSKGTYSTPSEVAEYIVEKTVKKTSSILDPSCGSGIFLVKALKKLTALNKDIDVVELVNNYIFGIDLDNDSVDITILSLYITILDYVNDFSDFKFPYLKNRNIFHADFFDSKLNKLKSFDAIVGNPPWFQAKGESQLFEKYVKKNFCVISNRQIAQAFIIRACDFLKEDGLCSFILTSKILYNVRDIKFRRYMLNKLNVIEIFDLTLIRNHLFKNTAWPSFILTYNCQKPGDIIKYKSITPLKSQFRYIYQRDVLRADLLRYDWMFKTLLVGREDDFNLILKLKRENITLKEFILKHPYFKAGVGFKKSQTNRGINAEDFINKAYVNVKNEDLKRYKVSPSDKWKYPYIRSVDLDLVKPPFVLMKSTFSSEFDFTAAYSSKEMVFDYNTFAIKGRFCDEAILKNIMALINSELFKYFFYMTGNVGVEKNRSTFSERKNFPINKNIINNQKLYELVCLRENDDENAKHYEDEINKLIFKAYKLSSSEIRLIKGIFR